MKTGNFKTIITGRIMTIMILSATVLACNQQKPEDPKEIAEEMNDEKFESNKSEKDAQFLVNAAEINLMEIKISELAATKAVTTEIKKLSQMMIDEHKKNHDDLINLAGSKSVSIPTALTNEGEDSYKTLDGKNGDAFDKEYCDMIVKDHRDAIDKFEKASTESQDPEIKNWATLTLPVLRNHLDQALVCQEKMK